jgi:hypothetical protein
MLNIGMYIQAKLGLVGKAFVLLHETRSLPALTCTAQ